MTEEAKEAKEAMKYPNNEIDSFQNGVVMDLRVRLAIEFMKSPGFQARGDLHPSDLAHRALQISEELLKQADERGWLTPMSKETQLSEGAKNQAKRIGAFQYYQQLGAGRAAQDEQSRVLPAAPAVKPGMH